MVKITGKEKNIFILKEIGTRIKDTRISIFMTQKELAMKSGVSEKTIERIENGDNIKIENLLNVLRVLDCLQNIELLIPAQEFLTKEEAMRKRKRASKKSVRADITVWKWGEEES